MENQNLKLNEERNTKFVSSFNKKLGLKSLLIGVFILLLLIPIKMIESQIENRENTARYAMDEVFNQWSNKQLIMAPNISYNVTSYYKDKDDKKTYSTTVTKRVLPNSLRINGEITSQKLKRGIYEIVTYNAPLEITGDFLFTKEELQQLHEATSNMKINISLSDLKGVSEEIVLILDSQKCTLIPNGEGIIERSKEFSSSINVEEWKAGVSIPFKMVLNLKGSQSLKFVPIGKVTSVNITSNCQTPSFTGEFLPINREVKEDGFSSEWKVSYVNRSYPQMFSVSKEYKSSLEDSSFGVNLLLPVQHYQKSLRCVKYAELFVVLTFVIFFFIEIIQKKKVHPIQYILVGLALTLFYSLLLSISEHLGFTPAYMISSVMTILMLTVYSAAILKIRKTAFFIGGALSVLYMYIFILIGMETYALLAGSLGLFVILALLMYISQRVDWTQAE